jgi:hypothetical protein
MWTRRGQGLRADSGADVEDTVCLGATNKIVACVHVVAVVPIGRSTLVIWTTPRLPASAAPLYVRIALLPIARTWPLTSSTRVAELLDRVSRDGQDERRSPKEVMHFRWKFAWPTAGTLLSDYVEGLPGRSARDGRNSRPLVLHRGCPNERSTARKTDIAIH